VFPLFGLKGQRGRFDAAWVSRIIARIGRAAGVKVNTDARTGKVKFASAHDLRRSFGERWAVRVMPKVLQELKRRESIETTMRFYVGRNAETTADAAWAAYQPVGNTLVTRAQFSTRAHKKGSLQVFSATNLMMSRDRTAIELFDAGIRNWEAGLRRRMEDGESV
jgi:hypothetical protein